MGYASQPLVLATQRRLTGQTPTPCRHWLSTSRPESSPAPPPPCASAKYGPASTSCRHGSSSCVLLLQGQITFLAQTTLRLQGAPLQTGVSTALILGLMNTIPHLILYRTRFLRHKSAHAALSSRPPFSQASLAWRGLNKPIFSTSHSSFYSLPNYLSGLSLNLILIEALLRLVIS